jgi:hypothetical protein
MLTMSTKKIDKDNKNNKEKTIIKAIFLKV